MTVKEFLITNEFIKLKTVAERMYPTNVDAQSYLRRKLSGSRPFTKADAENALKVLGVLKLDISTLTAE